jgi:hypothetical protein
VPEVDDRASDKGWIGVWTGRDDLARGLDAGHERQVDR